METLLDKPRGAKALYVFGHGAGAPMQHRFMQAMSELLTERKIATLRYQFPYMEAGKRRPDPQKVLLAAVREAVALGGKKARGLPLFAGGKSMGGRMTSLAASQEELLGVRGLAFLGFPLHAPGKDGTERAAHLSEFDLPLLFVQGTRDKLANLDLLQPVIDDLGARATLHIVDQGDHSLGVPKRSGRSEAEVLGEVADVVSDWVDNQVV